MADEISLLDKLNTDVKELQKAIGSLYILSCLDAVSINSLKNIAERYEKDREDILQYMEASTKILNILIERVDALEQSQGIVFTAESASPRGGKSMLELVKNQILKLFKRG